MSPYVCYPCPRSVHIVDMTHPDNKQIIINAYRKVFSIKYHPDKNSEGAETFKVGMELYGKLMIQISGTVPLAEKQALIKEVKSDILKVSLILYSYIYSEAINQVRGLANDGTFIERYTAKYLVNLLDTHASHLNRYLYTASNSLILECVLPKPKNIIVGTTTAALDKLITKELPNLEERARNQSKCENLALLFGLIQFPIRLISTCGNYAFSKDFFSFNTFSFFQRSEFKAAVGFCLLGIGTIGLCTAAYTAYSTASPNEGTIKYARQPLAILSSAYNAMALSIWLAEMVTIVISHNALKSEIGIMNTISTLAFKNTYTFITAPTKAPVYCKIIAASLVIGFIYDTLSARYAYDNSNAIEIS